MRVAIFFYAFIAFVSTGFNAFAQRAAAKPFVVNYPPKTYNAHPQNWQVRVAPSGMVYVANGEGLLEFDGAEWRLYPLEGKPVVRSLDIGPDGKVYIGCKQEFGLFAPGKDGKLRYASLAGEPAIKGKPFKRVIQTCHTEEGVFFMAEELVSRLYKDSLYVYQPPSLQDTWFNFFRTGDKSFAVSREGGFFVFENGSFKKIDTPSPENGAFFGKGNPLMAFKQADKNDYTAISGRGDIWSVRIAGTSVVETKRLAPETSAILQDMRIYGYAAIPDGRTAIATLDGGARLIAPNGIAGAVYGKAAGVMDNKVYNAVYSEEGKLWLSLGKGIAKVDDASPWRYFDNSDGFEGTVDGVLRFEGSLYVATSVGIYLLGADGRFARVEGVKTQVKEIHAFSAEDGDALLAACNDGVYEIKGPKAEKIYALESVYTIEVSKTRPGLFFVGSGAGLSAMERRSGKWVLAGEDLDGAKKIVRNIAEDPAGDLWIGYDHAGGGRLRLDKNLNTVSREHFGSNKGLSEKYTPTMFAYKNEILAGTEKGLYKFDAKTSRFLPDARFADMKREVWLFSQNPHTGEIWAGGTNSQEMPLRVYTPAGSGFAIDSLLALGLPAFYQPSVYFGDSGLTYIATTEGLFVHSAAKKKDYRRAFPALIRKIVINGDSVAYWGGLPQAPALKLPYGMNSLAFRFAALDFEDEKALQYSVFLENHDDKWSEWNTSNFKEYSKLWEGGYVLKVKAKNIYGTESAVAEVAISISAPWFRTLPAYLSYAAAILFAVFGATRWNSQRLEAENEKLENAIRERTAEITQQKEEIEQQADNLQKINETVLLKNTELELQKEEIEAQSENLRQANTEILVQKDELQKSFDNVRVLSEIGREITGTLDLNIILNTVYKHVNELMDASVFGIGIFNPEDESITYELAIEKGVRYKPYTRDMKDKNQFPVWCVENKKNIFINDIYAEYSNYITEYKDTKYVLEDGSIAETPRSLIYAPLLSHDIILGIITVQSFRKDSYTRHHLNILNSLSVYASTALDNAQAYQVIKKSKEHITDSIRYAKTIQFAILPSQAEMDAALGEYFVLFKPKDIVSGDFYWFAQLLPEETGSATISFIAAVDCTGHGVPGAFMSMIANTLLNEIVKQKHVCDTAEILEQLDAGIRQALHQEEKANDDGMDVCLAGLSRLPDGRCEVSFTGAKRPLYYLPQAGGEIEELKADKRSIGGLQLKKRDFATQKLRVSPGGSIYLSTDGIMDQSDPLKQKLGTKQFMKILETGTENGFEGLKAILEEALDKHQQDAPQRDDITVIGIRIT